MKVNAKTGAVTMAWRDRRAIVLHRAAFTCEECLAATATEVDHIWPRSMGGQDDLHNLRATCMPCNRKKGGKAFVADITAERAGWSFNHYMAKAHTAALSALRFALIEARLMGTDESPDVAFQAVEDEGLPKDELLDLLINFCLAQTRALQESIDQVEAQA